jgi:hypothetical protein
MLLGAVHQVKGIMSCQKRLIMRLGEAVGHCRWSNFHLPHDRNRILVETSQIWELCPKQLTNENTCVIYPILTLDIANGGVVRSEKANQGSSV